MSLCWQRMAGKLELMRKEVGPRDACSRWRIDQREQRRGSSGSLEYMAGQEASVVVVVVVVVTVVEVDAVVAEVVASGRNIGGSAGVVVVTILF